MGKASGVNTLPPKELSLFKRVVKYYDQKQYKNGLKYAKQILSNPKYSEHGETLAMKGILLNCLGKKEEARDCVKRGLQANISSFICWHVYGLIQKSDRKYEEAIKCYLQALRLDSENIQVLRDLSVLQMQLRNYEGCKDTRYKLLMLRPSHKASWIGYAVVHHLLANYDIALTVLNEFRKSQGDTASACETSELALYQARLLVEAGKGASALEYLNEFEGQTVDQISLLEMKAQIYIALKKNEEAKAILWRLIDRNFENRQYFELLCQTNGYNKMAFSTQNCDIARLTYEEIVERYPRSKLAQRLILEQYHGEQFTARLDWYLKFYLRKGVPPLFVQLRNLWRNSRKLKVLEKLLVEYQNNMNSYQSLQTDPLIAEPPSTLVWLNYLVAQFLSYGGRPQEAIDLIDRQLLSTPTLVDFYVLKADVYYDAGDVITASRWMEEAQSLDTADRYINARCTKLLVQANRAEEAVFMASKFTRGTTSAADYLSEMQCMWFLIENARTFKSLKKYGESLKLCHEVEQHYRNIMDDQLDFHSYCLRKGTLNAYVETLRLEDRLRDHPSYYEVAHLAIEIYLHLFAFPLGAEDEDAGGDQAKVITSEAKKLRNKQRKAAKRAEAEAVRVRAEQERREQALRSRNPGGEEPDPERPAAADTGLDPYVLSRPTDPLEEACKFLRPLLDLSPTRIEVFCLAYEIYERKSKWLLMLRSIKHGQRLPESSNHPWFHECCVRFLCKLKQNQMLFDEQKDSHVSLVLAAELPSMFAGWPDAINSLPASFNSAFRHRNADSFVHVFRASLLKCLIEPTKRFEFLSNLPSPSDDFNGTTWQMYAESLSLLKNANRGPLGEVSLDIIERFRLACAQKFPMANVFLADAARDELRDRMIAAATESSVSGVYTTYAGDAGSRRVDQVSENQLNKPFSCLRISDRTPLVNGSIEGAVFDNATLCPNEA